MRIHIMSVRFFYVVELFFHLVPIYVNICVCELTQLVEIISEGEFKFIFIMVLPHTAGLDTIFVQIYMDPPPGVPGVSKNQIFFFTNKTVEFLR